MSAPKLLPLLLALPLLLLASCSVKKAGPEPWHWQYTEGYTEQITRQGLVVAEIRLEGLEFTGAAAAAAVNGWLGELQEAQLAGFRTMSEQYFADVEFNGVTLENRLYYTVEKRLSVFYNDPLTLSIVAEEQVYITGEPHPSVCRYAYNFDAATGTPLQFEDIGGADAREKAAAQIYAQIEQAGELGDYYADLAELLVQNLTPYDWYLDADNVYIIYNPYEIAPYVAGIQIFSLPR